MSFLKAHERGMSNKYIGYIIGKSSLTGSVSGSLSFNDSAIRGSKLDQSDKSKMLEMKCVTCGESVGFAHKIEDPKKIFCSEGCFHMRT